MTISQETIEELSRGDQRAFQQVFKATYPKVMAFALGFTKDKYHADEIAQNVFISLWTHRERLIQVHNLDAYLFKMAKNAVLNFMASQKTITIDITAVKGVTAYEASAQMQLEAQDLRLLTDMIVENMAPQRKAVYRMSREEGLTNDEIARRTGLQKKTVENHLNLALGEIRKMLKILILLLLQWG